MRVFIWSYCYLKDENNRASFLRQINVSILYLWVWRYFICTGYTINCISLLWGNKRSLVASIKSKAVFSFNIDWDKFRLSIYCVNKNGYNIYYKNSTQDCDFSAPLSSHTQEILNRWRNWAWYSIFELYIFLFRICYWSTLTIVYFLPQGKRRTSFSICSKFLWLP